MLPCYGEYRWCLKLCTTNECCDFGPILKTRPGGDGRLDLIDRCVDING